MIKRLTLAAILAASLMADNFTQPEAMPQPGSSLSSKAPSASTPAPQAATTKKKSTHKKSSHKKSKAKSTKAKKHKSHPNKVKKIAPSA